MKILLIDKVHSSFKDKFNQWGWNSVEGYDWTYEKIENQIAEFDGVIIRSRIVLDFKILSFATKLKFIGRPGAGLENIDLNFCEKKNILVFRSPEGNRDALGEHIIGMLLSLLNNLYKADFEVRKGEWVREGNRGRELKGKTVGIIGYGYMGRSFAQKLSGFEVNVIAYDKYLKGFGSELVDEVTLDEIFKKTDILSLHTPLSSETINMVNTIFLNKFQKPIILINSARGDVIDNDALIEALKNKTIAGAGLDVFEGEPELNPGFLDCENAVLLPHLGSASTETRIAMGMRVLENMVLIIVIKNLVIGWLKKYLLCGKIKS